MCVPAGRNVFLALGSSQHTESYCLAHPSHVLMRKSVFGNLTEDPRPDFWQPRRSGLLTLTLPWATPPPFLRLSSWSLFPTWQVVLPKQNKNPKQFSSVRQEISHSYFRIPEAPQPSEQRASSPGRLALRVRRPRMEQHSFKEGETRQRGRCQREQCQSVTANRFTLQKLSEEPNLIIRSTPRLGLPERTSCS